jgi:carbonic anhydrase
MPEVAMRRREALKLFAGLALCPLCAPDGFAADPHWSYEGAEGPDKWGELDAANKVCSIGGQQSPINIGETIKAQLQPLKIAWGKTAESIVNNGHTIQVNMPEGSTMSAGGGGNFRLLQFHFHRPSEHTINGASFPMEVHFLHANAAGNFAAIGVLMTTGRTNKAFNNIVLTMPNRAGSQVKAESAVDPNAFLPPKRGYYRYYGSLTTPPCAQTVDWFVLTDPIQVAEADINSFARLYPKNARPVQPDNRRFVLRSS